MSRRAVACALLATLPALHGATAADDARALDAQTIEPRAFGYRVGDVLQRRVVVHVPDGLVLDEASVPRPGARGRALELRSVRRAANEGGVELVLEYQVFLSPPAVRTLEMPPVTLHFDGRPRAQDLRIDAWPVTVAPLVPVEASPRRGLGDLQPDVDAPPLPTAPMRLRLQVYGVAAGVLAAALAVLYLGLPWWGRRHRPFARAWPLLRRLARAGDDAAAWRAACQRLHAAFNESAGEVLFEHGIERFVARRPAFGALQQEMRRFLAISRRGFFGDGTHAPGELAWLVDFGRRCRDAERFS